MVTTSIIRRAEALRCGDLPDLGKRSDLIVSKGEKCWRRMAPNSVLETKLEREAMFLTKLARANAAATSVQPRAHAAVGRFAHSVAG